MRRLAIVIVCLLALVTFINAFTSEQAMSTAATGSAHIL